MGTHTLSGVLDASRASRTKLLGFKELAREEPIAFPYCRSSSLVASLDDPLLTEGTTTRQAILSPSMSACEYLVASFSV